VKKRRQRGGKEKRRQERVLGVFKKEGRSGDTRQKEGTTRRAMGLGGIRTPGVVPPTKREGRTGKSNNALVRVPGREGWKSCAI